MPGSNYTHIPLREKDTGTNLDVLYSAYTSSAPPVHQRQLGKVLFLGKMQAGIYPWFQLNTKTRPGPV